MTEMLCTSSGRSSTLATQATPSTSLSFGFHAGSPASVLLVERSTLLPYFVPVRRKHRPRHRRATRGSGPIGSWGWVMALRWPRACHARCRRRSRPAFAILRRLQSEATTGGYPDAKRGEAPRTFQDLILTLQRYWAERGCVIIQPYDMEMGGRHVPHRHFPARAGPEPWSAAYVQPSRRPTDGRYGDKPVPPAALLPVPGGHQAVAVRHHRPVPGLAARGG